MTDLGPVTLHVDPKSIRLNVGAQEWTFANDHLIIVTKGKRRSKKRSIHIADSNLYVAQAWPTHDVGLWIERRPGVMQRVLGLPPLSGISENVMEAWRDLERLSTRMKDALAQYTQGRDASELGVGQNRVLVLQGASKLVVYARAVFRERARRVVEVRCDGTVVMPGRKKSEHVISMERGAEVMPSGDRINFCHADGEHAASLFLPWISAADRAELARRFQRALLVDSPLGEPLLSIDE